MSIDIGLDQDGDLIIETDKYRMYLYGVTASQITQMIRELTKVLDEL